MVLGGVWEPLEMAVGWRWGFFGDPSENHHQLIPRQSQTHAKLNNKQPKPIQNSTIQSQSSPIVFQAICKSIQIANTTDD